MKRAFGGLLVVAVLAGAGGAGWWMWRWMQEVSARQAALSAKLSEAETHLTQLNQEHHALQATHEALERKQAEAEADLRRVNATSSLLSEQLQAATKDKAAAAEQLAQVSHDYEQLTHERTALRGQFEALLTQKEKEAASLKELEGRLGQLSEAQAAAGQEREALHRTLEEGRLQAEQLADRISDVSVAYDQLLSAKFGARSGRDARQRASATPKPMSPQEKRRQAGVHRDLGEAYWAMELYPKAAKEFEESLQYHNDPQVHAQLTLLYSRFLHDAAKASFHLSKAKGARLLSAIPLEGPYQLPRNSTTLAQQYLRDQ